MDAYNAAFKFLGERVGFVRSYLTVTGKSTVQLKLNKIT